MAADRGKLTDARVWLHILRGVLQTDGYRSPVTATDQIYARFKQRFPQADGFVSDETAAGPLHESKLEAIREAD